MKASKGCFGAKAALYLGHVVSANGVHTDAAKIESVKKIATHQNVRQIRSFVGLAEYYRKFVHSFSILAYPLVELTKKGKRFCWTEVHDITFSALKAILCSSPVLAITILDKTKASAVEKERFFSAKQMIKNDLAFRHRNPSGNPGQKFRTDPPTRLGRVCAQRDYHCIPLLYVTSGSFP